MKIERQLTNGMWTEIEDEGQKKKIFARLIEFESWYAKRVNREPITTEKQIIEKLKTGAIIAFDEGFGSSIRDFDSIKKPTAEQKKIAAEAKYKYENDIVDGVNDEY